MTVKTFIPLVWFLQTLCVVANIADGATSKMTILNDKGVMGHLKEFMVCQRHAEDAALSQKRSSQSLEFVAETRESCGKQIENRGKIFFPWNKNQQAY